MAVTHIWDEEDCRVWHDMLARYPEVVARYGGDRLAALDKWYREELPRILASREEPYVTLDELDEVASWKMTRGVWRERNRQLIKGNNPEMVDKLSREAFKQLPDIRKPINTLAELSGVGPATASAVLAAYAPQFYPFFDEVVAAGVPGLGPTAFTTKYYVAYAGALAERTARLNAVCADRVWTPHEVGLVIWAFYGGEKK